ncbi:uncharacterized protein [Montipora capricornis]|uniref:uncharacterized protein n=1 Tax=Montipora capricornis TaxID=246305 RepID=UPI0035F1E06C
MVYRKSISYFLCLLFLLILIDSMKTKVFQFKHYNFRKKQRLAKKYLPLEKDCEATKCQGHGGLELIKCTRKCISQLCYDELYAWDELEEGEIDVRLTSFKGCVVKQLQDQESRTRGL